MLDRSPIISPESLHARLGSPHVRIVDVRWVLGSPGGGRAAYDAGHLPGAIFLDLDTDLADREGPGRHPLPRPAAFRECLETAGIGDSDEVVAYDDAGGSVAARLWWMLDDLGHERVRVLEGGIGGWVAAGFPLTTDVPAPHPRGRLHLRDAWSKVIDRAGVSAGLGEFVLLDARSGPRYRGEVEPIDAVPGHIPTARSAPVDGNLGPDGRLLPAAALAARFETLGAGDAAGLGRHLVRERRHRMLQQPRDADRRPPGSDPLPRVVQRLEPRRDAHRGWAGARRSARWTRVSRTTESDLYGDLAPWFHLLTPPEEYADEAAFALGLLRDQVVGPLETMLELGSGGGNMASHLKAAMQLTLTDVSPQMLELSASINPDCEHRLGDMRTVRLGRTFDAVLIHDAICYMTTEADLRAAMLTAFEHLRPGGAAVFEPDHIRETFEVGTDHGGEDGDADAGRRDGRAMRYLEWTTDPDPSDTTYQVDYAVLLRETDGSVEVRHDQHVEGLFARQTWLDLLADVGFEARGRRGRRGPDRVRRAATETEAVASPDQTAGLIPANPGAA